MTKLTPFETLGLPPTASLTDVKQAWHEFALTHHPDRNGDPEKFQYYHTAYKAAVKQVLTPKRCEPCKGTGRTWQQTGFARVKVLCAECRGSGKEI